MNNKDYADKHGGWVEDYPREYKYPDDYIDFDLGEIKCME